MPEFDEDTSVERVEEGRWRGVVNERWNVGSAPNGGYVAALGLAAAAGAVPHPDPFTVTTHYLGRLSPGPVDLDVEVIRAGRSHSTAEVRISQEGREAARQLAMFGALDELSGKTVIAGSPPDLPEPDSLPSNQLISEQLPRVARRFDLRIDPATAGWMSGADTARAEIAGWARFADGREPDAASLVLFADVFPPAVLSVAAEAGWIPTLEMTTHIRAKPAPGWLACAFRTRYLIGGYLEEDGELWDAKGRLVALSRQMARVHLPRRR